MLATALGLGKALAGKFLMKNAGKLVGSAVHKMKNSNVGWINKAGNMAGSVINKASGMISDEKVKEQLENATKEANGQNVNYNFNFSDSKPTPPQTEEAKPTAVAFYNKNLGGTNFLRYKGRKKFKRVNVGKHTTRINKRPFGNSFKKLP